MALLIRFYRLPGHMAVRRLLTVLSGLLLLAGLPVTAQAGWFYRDNQVAYQLYEKGENRQALDHWDESAQGQFGKGVVLMRMGRMHEAEEAFRTSLELMPHQMKASGDVAGSPDDPGFLASIWYNLGNCLYGQGELRPASKAWRTALNYLPDHAKARHNLKVVKRLLGKEVADDEQTPPAGLTRKQRRGPHEGQQPSASDDGKKRTQKQASTTAPHHGDKGKRMASNAEHKTAGKKSQKQGGGSRSMAARHPARPKHAADNKAHPSQAGTMSARQAEHELHLVKEGVGVFLRHRLNRKSPRAEAYGGPAW
ncbi:MAG TPA: tetratricopeptide repeat protein [Mariprofundaceae bacterium]|nr:tetratricopeptide repeat protein [Mariprofundaceae bacterium]